MPGDGDSARPVPTGRGWRARWRALDEHQRAHIADRVRSGSAVGTPGAAALAVHLAVRLRRETVAAAIVAPVAVLLAVAAGAAAGRFTRRGSPRAAFLDVVTWGGGLPWLALAALASLLLLAASRRWRARLAAAERANRAVVGDVLTRRGPPPAERRGTRRSPGASRS